MKRNRSDEHNAVKEDDYSPQLEVKTTRKGNDKYIHPQKVSLHSTDFVYSDIADEMKTKIAKSLNSGDPQVIDTNQLEERLLSHYQTQGQAWEQHYIHTQNNHFPMKNYICQAFPDLYSALCKTLSDPNAPILNILECGCGSGSVILPLLRFLADPQCVQKSDQPGPGRFHFIGFDVSTTAVNLFKGHDALLEFEQSGLGKVTAFPHDATSKEDIPLPATGHIDKILLIFVLCALPVPDMLAALQKLRRTFGPGGGEQELYFRDYASCDHNHLRYAERVDSTMAEGSFVKGDGTQQFFFDITFTEDLFRRAGFKVREVEFEAVEGGQGVDAKKIKTKRLIEYHCNRVVNRGNGKQMNKVFINATFVPMPLDSL